MHDIRAIRSDPAGFDAALARRGLASVSSEILAQDAERRFALTALQEKQARRNAISRDVGQGRRSGADTSALEGEAASLRGEMEGLEKQAAVLDEAIKRVLEGLPNVLDPDVPDGPDETFNVVLKQHGEPRDLGFQPKQHFELGEALGMMDFAAAAKIAGTRFVVLRGPLARLERALGQFMIDLHTREHGYTEYVVPSLVNDATAYGTDKLPKFADTLFQTTDGRWLIPTAEVPLTALVMGDIVAEKDLPMRVTALTDCFRSEAGAAGRDTRGMLRQHQFRKVEMVSIVHPDRSAEEHERMTSMRREGADLAGGAVPARRAVVRRHGVRSGEDLRSGGLAAGAAGLARDQLLLQLPRLPGATDERAVPLGGREDHRASPYAERLGRGVGTRADRGDGEPSAGGRLDPDPQRAVALHGRNGAHCARTDG